MTNKRRVTLSDIAEKAGVHKSTVSLALRGDPRVGKETRERIIRISEEIGHQPDTHLSHLMSYLRSAKREDRNESIAYLRFESPHDENMDNTPFFREFRLGAQSEILDLGYSFDEFHLNDYEFNFRRLGDVLYHRGIKGLLISPPVGLLEIKDFDWNKFTAITLGFRLHNPLLNRVVCDQITIVRLALNNLIKLGYTRPLLALTTQCDIHAENRWSTSFNGLAKHFTALKGCTVHMGGADEEFLQCLSKSKSDCILGLDYSYAQLLLDKGIAIPDEYGFVLLDRDSGPNTVTGIDQQPRYLGQLAVRQLSDFIGRNELGLSEQPLTLMIQPAWHPGSTVISRNMSSN